MYPSINERVSRQVSCQCFPNPSTVHHTLLIRATVHPRPYSPTSFHGGTMSLPSSSPNPRTTAPKRRGPGPRPQTYHSYYLHNPNPNNLVSVMSSSEEVPPGSTPPTTSAVNTSVAATSVAVSQADFMAFQRMMLHQFAALTTAIDRMSSRSPTPPPPQAPTVTSTTSFPYGMTGYGGIPALPTHTAPSIPSPPASLHSHLPPSSSIANLHLAATHIDHTHTHPSDTLNPSHTPHHQSHAFPNPTIAHTPRSNTFIA
jgi:hypothetical protein